MGSRADERTLAVLAGRTGWGGMSFRIIASRGHPLPASPCLRRGRSQGKSSRPRPLLHERARRQRVSPSSLSRRNEYISPSSLYLRVRKSVVQGSSVTVRVDLGGRHSKKNKKT